MILLLYRTMFREFYMDRSDRKSPKAIEGITRKSMMAAFNSRGLQAGELSSASSRWEVYHNLGIIDSKCLFEVVM